MHTICVFLTTGRHCSDPAAKETEAPGGVNSFSKVTHFGGGRFCPLVGSRAVSAFLFLNTGLTVITNLCLSEKVALDPSLFYTSEQTCSLSTALIHKRVPSADSGPGPGLRPCLAVGSTVRTRIWKQRGST